MSVASPSETAGVPSALFVDEMVAARDNVRLVSAELESTFTELISGI